MRKRNTAGPKKPIKADKSPWPARRIGRSKMDMAVFSTRYAMRKTHNGRFRGRKAYVFPKNTSILIFFDKVLFQS